MRIGFLAGAKNPLRITILFTCFCLLAAGCAARTAEKRDDFARAEPVGNAESTVKPADKTALNGEKAPATAARVESNTESPNMAAKTGAAKDPFADDPFEKDYKDQGPLASDPLEPVNRATFWVNDKLYLYAFKPLVKGYRFIVPEFMRAGLSNFFKNLGEPISLANDLIQLNFNEAFKSGFRFTVNSTVGVLGLMDVAASQGGVYRQTQDFGLTMGHYGVGHGFYLVLPFLGPSSLRDGLGKVGDLAFTPLTYADLTVGQSLEVRGVDLFNEFSMDKDTYEAVSRQAIDPYATFRDGYLQRRKFLAEK